MKKYLLGYTPASLQDIGEAVNYYNQQQRGLGNKFISDIKRTTTAIRRTPLFASVKYDNVRCAGLQKFPFSIHYTINKLNLTVTIIAIFNTRREPFW